MENIRTGASVFCDGDKVGHVARLIADSRTSRVTDIVVDRGLLHGAKIVSLDGIAGVKDDGVHLSLSREQFEHADGFVNKRFANPSGSWVGPPGFNSMDYLLDVEVAEGAAGYGVVGKPSPFPPSPADPLPNLIRPTLKPGTAVRAAGGEEVGEIAEVDFHPDDGRLTKLVIKRGLLGHEHVELPLTWVDDIGEDGLILNVSKDELEQRHPAQT